MNITVVGLGTIGCGWAVVFARAGHRVRLFDSSGTARARAVETIRRILSMPGAQGLTRDLEQVMARIDVADCLENAVVDADYVQENIIEDEAAKIALFTQIDVLAPPEAICASSTSSLPGSSFFADVAGRDRCLIVHPANPPYLIPLVEICPTPWTSPAVRDRCIEMMQAMGQQPVLVTREIDGFILNRLQFTLLGEALRLVADGYCSPADVDRVMTHGLGLRWALYGPFAVAHMGASGGFRQFIHHLGPAIERIGCSQRDAFIWDQALIDHIHDAIDDAHGDGVADMQATRDRRLTHLLEHLAVEGIAI